MSSIITSNSSSDVITVYADRDYSVGETICELRGASWELVAEVSPTTLSNEKTAKISHQQTCGSFYIPEKSIAFLPGCPASFNAVYIGPFVDSIIATQRIAHGSPIFVFTCLVAYRFPVIGTVTCACGCGQQLGGFSSLSEVEQQRFTYLTEPNVRQDAYAAGYLVRTLSQQELLEIRPNGEMGLAVFALRHIPRGTVLFKSGGLLVPRATMYTIQVGENVHALFGDGAECIAHSCDPNVVVIPCENPSHEECLQFVAYRNIEAGELLGFNYQSTEWQMQQSFDCLCRTALCFGRIAGFSNATCEQRARMWDYASNVVKDIANKEEHRVS